MHLINARTLALEQFHASDVPRFAILSHALGLDAGEVSFQDMSANMSGAMKKPGFRKIRRACKLAVLATLEYIYIDMCCIDMKSSAGVSEAVNSVFSRFQCATICYVYLADVPPEPDIEKMLDIGSPFSRCRWFKRGWTLQQLIAPPVVHFFDCEWNLIGTKKTLAGALSQITHIPVSCLVGCTAPDDYSIAERMSWAAQRRTTRIEDKAYCLVGLFNVKMPVIYGEAEEAFVRLQEEIMKQTTDQSLLAWFQGDRQLDSRGLSPQSILAESPSYFPTRPGGKIMKDLGQVNGKHQRITRTKVGIVMWAPVIHTLSDHLVFAILNCKTSIYGDNVWIPLCKTERGSYHRVAFPVMTFFDIGTLTGAPIEPTELCLEEPVSFPDRADNFYSSNPLHVERLPTVEHSEQEIESPIEVLAVFLDGEQLSSRSAPYMYPPKSSHKDNRSGILRLRHRGDDYHHGILVFQLDSNHQDKTIAIFFAAIYSPSRLDKRIHASTCRVLVGLDVTSSTDLEKLSASELAKICSDEQVPSSSLFPIDWLIWRHRDQNGNTAVELVEVDKVLIAKIMFNAPNQDGSLSESVTAAFEKMKDTKGVTGGTAKLSLT
ncbi:hypothetical protein L207DRAFT_519129 [Hyaloscypha variabilis F]|uniref:DUF8212 domain-containing protein n=1 Tax=Hyaloscypha variabilis (strain UAMH 11265 / GT02V1 / F) TaxID=1149755 RepID=A0A2J6QZU3_HYAVF|nr:hypothetical protein L207DRAFT_519129 [Hyaloscypha variabilis F]